VKKIKTTSKVVKVPPGFLIGLPAKKIAARRRKTKNIKGCSNY